jgi:hypothetical protein
MPLKLAEREVVVERGAKIKRQGEEVLLAVELL